MKYVDLTYAIVDNMPVFPGDPPMSLKQVASIKERGYTDHQLTTAMHVGTHIDAPLHMIEGGARIDEIAADRFIGSGILIDARGKEMIDESFLYGKTLTHDSVVLICTGTDKKYRTPLYDTQYPTITESFAQKLADAKVKILGIDFINPDKDDSFPIHKILLSRQVLIIENLTNIDSLIGVNSFDVIAFPMKLHAEAAPVRVVAMVK
ncbi:MAG TPA: cyclase family protein [Patescibacteria group bacterium]|nr:cyclase family protein [Patescibacteria group bacterium]